MFCIFMWKIGGTLLERITCLSFVGEVMLFYVCEMVLILIIFYGVYVFISNIVSLRVRGEWVYVYNMNGGGSAW